ncbi:hypothetical protein [Nonomuraea dietziae]|uniref:hypothetical protein n=1 Tax=Nonomuraea dietziae TaxID=65515 RepID=UPI0031DC714C
MILAAVFEALLRPVVVTARRSALGDLLAPGVATAGCLARSTPSWDSDDEQVDALPRGRVGERLPIPG